MMKAQGPKFETCLFGPSGEAISVKPYREILREEKQNQKESNDNDSDNDALRDVNANEISVHGSGNSDVSDVDHSQNIDGDDNSNSNNSEKAIRESVMSLISNQDEDQCGGDGDGDGDDGGKPMTDDDDESGQAQSPTQVTSTPPQTPIKPSPPSRPIKPPSTAKKSKRRNSNDGPTPTIAGTGINASTSRNHNHAINLQELRRLSSQGVPDDCTLRPLAWRVMLGYLPLDTSKWQAAMDRDRILYANLVEELFVLSEDYPFESEGQKLRGRGLKRDGEKVTVLNPAHSRNRDRNKNRKGAGAHNDMSTMMSALSKTNLLDEAEKNHLQRRGSANAHDSASKNLNDSTDANANGIEEDEDENSSNDNENKNRGPQKALDEPELEIPQIIMDQWRKSGRDPESLRAGMGSGRKRGGTYRHINALLVTNNDTANAESNDAHAVRKVVPLEECESRESLNDVDADTDTDPSAHKSSNGKGKSKERMEDIDPKWKHFLENASLLDEIRKDVVRTHPDLQFFLEPTDNLGARRYAAIERILFIWAKLNKGVRYVQGMNEIVGTMYFVLANDENEEWASEAEADTYFLFNTLMVEMRDIFVPDLDEADTGIQGRMANMLALLSLHDPEVRCHLDDCGIDPAFYSIRWLTTLLSREFLLPDTIRLWDSMFASTHKDNFMRYVCVCMVMIIREDLLKGDFGTCLRLLQSYPPTDVDQLLESSRALWIYESQVTLACHKGGISLSQALTTIAPPPAVIMAYGLNGGLALDQLERMRKEVMDAMAGKNQGGSRFRKTMNNLGGGGRSSNGANHMGASSTAGKSSFFGFFGNKR